MSKTYDNWCPEIYRGIFIDRHNNDYVQIAPCCQAQSKRESVDNFNFDNSPYLNELRHAFNQGKKPSECDRCWKLEEVGHKSRRQSMQEFYNVHPSNQVQLESIDYSATWACNMACIMCGPYNSSFWANELNYTPDQLVKIGRKFQKDNDILGDLNLACIKKIHFNGGEPFLNNHQFDLLQKLEQQDVLKNTFISYNTNGSIFPSEKIIDHWRCGQLVKLFFSIDATGAAFEYIRWPGKWYEVSTNIQRMRDQLPGNVMFGLNVTVGNYNLLELSDLISWFNTTIATNRDGDPSDFNWQIANNFDPQNATIEIKRQCIDQLQDNSLMSGVVEYIKSTLDYRDDSWIQVLDNIDKRRNTSWRKSLKISEYY